MMRELLLLVTVTLCGAPPPSDGDTVPAVPAAVRSAFELSPFYVKYLDVEGLPVVGSARVSDAAMREAVWIVRKMIGHRPEILRAMAAAKVRLAVMAYDEYTTDIPEHATLTPKAYWDRRARGLGASRQRPAVSCAEENLLAFPGDPYSTENICIHEFAHAIHAMGMRTVDPKFNGRLREAYTQAREAGLWKDTYAATNYREYWAEGAQSWFDDNREPDAVHNHVNTRVELKQYDPALALLCEEVFGDGTWRYVKPAHRPQAERTHLADYDLSTAPRFVWRQAPIVDSPRVRIQTTAGEIELELDAKRAPQTTRNFLRYVHEGLYSGGRFHRTVTPDNQPNQTVKIEVIQASANPNRRQRFHPPIELERTRDTGLKHVDGAVSMARAAPDSARDEIFICIGDQPELDFGGRRNPDGQGFAVFGKVVGGMDVVRKIHASAREGQRLSPPIMIQSALRLH